VRQPARILVVDDSPMNVEILQARLMAQGYEVVTAGDGEQALAAVREQQPDLILLDVNMPKLDGFEVCRRLRADQTLPFTPIVLVTARTDTKDVVAGLEAGGDEYLTKPVDQAALVARVKSMLRIKALHDDLRAQTARVEAQAAELAALNGDLERRVAEQVDELERVGRLRRFLAPQLAEAIVSAGDEAALASHRRQITVVFCDLRGFTAFAETAEPEEVMTVLSEYHAALGELIYRFGGTIEHFAGDGVMVFFNDPLPQSDHVERAVRMAVAMRERVGQLARGWRRQGHALDFGVGIALGYATLGRIGFEGRFDYAAIGTVTNLAARLCGEAAGGQILVSQRVQAAVEGLVEGEELGELTLKGFLRPVAAYNLIGLRQGDPMLTGRESGSPSGEA
jgi:class 3 adenylate cyclase/CheY-like chemotaxis protein